RLAKGGPREKSRKATRTMGSKRGGRTAWPPGGLRKASLKKKNHESRIPRARADGESPGHQRPEGRPRPRRARPPPGGGQAAPLGGRHVGRLAEEGRRGERGSVHVTAEVARRQGTIYGRCSHHRRGSAREQCRRPYVNIYQR